MQENMTLKKIIKKPVACYNTEKTSSRRAGMDNRTCKCS